MSAQVEEVRPSLGHIELAAHLFGPVDGLPVIALHGWLDNANSFARLAPLLRGLRIVALDLAGHGYSEHRRQRCWRSCAWMAKRKSVYTTLEQGVRARRAWSRKPGSAELLAHEPVPGCWRSQPDLAVAPERRPGHGLRAPVNCPAQLVIAADGMLVRHTALLEQLPFEQMTLPVATTCT